MNKRLRYLKAAFNKAIKRDYMTHNPMTGWEWTRPEQKIPRTLNDTEKGKLLDACPTDQWRALVFVALTTGCRIGELLELTWNRVDLDRAQIVVTGTKARKDRDLPLVVEAVPMLRNLHVSTLRDGGPFRALTYDAAACQLKKIVDDAEIAYCTLHDLRRTFCTDLAQAGVNQTVVQRLAGHASQATTERYYQCADDSMKRDAIAKLTVRAG